MLSTKLNYRKWILNRILNLGVVTLFFGSCYILFGARLEQHILSSFTPTLNTSKIKAAQMKAKAEASYDWTSVQSTNLASITKSRVANNANVIAFMTQPEAKIATTIQAGVSNEVLNVSAGTLRPDQELGKNNYVLAAHHMPGAEWALFSGLYYNAEVGQKVYLTDMEKVYEYEITSVRMVEETDVYIVDRNRYKEDVDGIVPGEPMITLISCDITGNKRITEYGTLKRVYDFNKDEIPGEAVKGFERAADFDWS